jgi:uncharacterized protein (TIGR03083 family)
MVDAQLDALRTSIARLRDIASALHDGDLATAAYPTEWTIAQVLSHLGSGAVITQRRLDDTVAGNDTPDDFAPSVWDTWNAKSPTEARDDALAADAALLVRLDTVTPVQRSAFSSAMGPMTLDFEQFVGMRLNEHALHTWDIEVVGDPAATVAQPAAGLLVDNLGFIARFTGRPDPRATPITVRTTDPDRSFTIDLATVPVTLEAGPQQESPQLELPAEAFARLIYGRLDPDHTPGPDQEETLSKLRAAFPGP